jgi:uncharacterized protein with PQ loop repeat
MRPLWSAADEPALEGASPVRSHSPRSKRLLMTVASLVGLAAAASGVFMALSPLLQARRIRAVGDSSEVSAGVFLMMRTNATIWLTYGIATGTAVIVVPNLVALVTTTTTLLAIKRFRHRAAHTPVAQPAARHHSPAAARVRVGAAAVVRAGGFVRR